MRLKIQRKNNLTAIGVIKSLLKGCFVSLLTLLLRSWKNTRVPSTLSSQNFVRIFQDIYISKFGIISLKSIEKDYNGLKTRLVRT